MHTEGTVREVVYAGAQTRLVVDTDAGPHFSVDLLNTALDAVRIARGDRITLSWPRAACRELEEPPDMEESA